MILTTIRVHGKTSKRKEIVQTIKDLADKTAKDKGCLKADLYMDMEDKDTLYFLEEWNTKRDLEKYKTSKSLAVLLGVEALLVESLEIKHAVKCESEEINDL